MQAADVTALTHQLLWGAFLLAAAFGALSQRSHFCTMGAIADVVSMGDWTRARMWCLAVATAAGGFGLLAGSGWIDPAAALYTAPRLQWASHLAGGLMFGAGMVLASGCGGKTLVRIGGGNLKSLVVLIVLAVAAFATLRGLTAVLRVATVDSWFLGLPSRQDLPSLLSPAVGISRRSLSAGLGLLAFGVLAVLALTGRGVDRAAVWQGGLGAGLLVSAMWWLSGHLGFVAEHPETLEPTYLGTATGRLMEAFSFVSPAASLLDWLLFYSDQSKLLSFGVVMPLGVIAGSAAVALATGQFRWEGFADWRDLARHLAGAVLMGVGGITALGCSVGQGLSGLSTLAPGSLLATAAIVAGAVAALRWQAWRMERLA